MKKHIWKLIMPIAFTAFGVFQVGMNLGRLLWSFINEEHVDFAIIHYDTLLIGCVCLIYGGIRLLLTIKNIKKEKN